MFIPISQSDTGPRLWYQYTPAVPSVCDITERVLITIQQQAI